MEKVSIIMRRFRQVLAAAIAGLPFFGYSQQTNEWIPSFVGNTPDTAYDWTSGDYWKIGTGPVDGCYFWIYPNTDNSVYIKTTDVAAQTFYAKYSTRFLGDVTVAAAMIDGTMKGGAFYSSGWHYGDVIFPESNYSTSMSGPTFCGLVRKYGSKTLNVTSGSVNFRFDRYARSASNIRTGDLDGLPNFYVGNGTISFYTPAAADAVSGIWRLNAGSPFAYRVSGSAHALAAGTAVTAGDALQEGVFLKHIFDDATIELSAPSLSTGEFTLDFAAFKPEFKATFPTKVDVVGGTGSGGVYLCAYRGQGADAACVSFENGLNFAGSMGEISFGSDSNTLLPATILLGPLTGDCSGGAIYLRNADIAFVDGVSFDAKHPVKMPVGDKGGYTATLSVTDGQSVSIASLGDFCGMIVKSGEGRLSVGMDDAANAGSFKVDGGSLEIIANASAGDGAIALKSLELAAGTSLVVPEKGLTVETFAAEGAITISGGKLTVLTKTACDFRNFIFRDGGTIDVPVSSDKGSYALDVGAGSVVGHPAFWLDASREDTIEYETGDDGVNYVTRWNDCREGETMFCTNLVLKPTFVNGTTMAEKYVRIARCDNVTDYNDTQILVWNVPIRDIRAVFLVQDPTEGGGCLLGRCSWRVDSKATNSEWGGPYYRGNYWSMSSAIVWDGASAKAVEYGRFFLNGREVDGTSTGYLGGYMQLVEHHVNTDYISGDDKVIVCDAFGGGYKNGMSQVKDSNGGMRIAEYIIYTNSLTHAERVGVAQYLSRKWFGRNVYCGVTDGGKYDDPDSLAVPGVEMRVGEGEEFATGPLEGGAFVKAGAGRAYIRNVKDTDIRVKEGELLISSLEYRYFIPADSILHVDANAAETLLADSDGESLLKWRDVGGLNEEVVNHGPVAAKIVPKASAGMAFVDLGPKPTYSNNGMALRHEGDNSGKIVKTGFAVYDSVAGGGAIFGSYGSGYTSRGFPHNRTAGESILCETSEWLKPGAWGGIPLISNAVASGTAVFKRNGETIDPFCAPFLNGLERLSFRYPAGRQVIHFGVYGQGDVSYTGGLKIGEIILFDRELSDAEMASTEAYLAKKWFDVDTSGYLYASEANKVEVDSGATLTVLGDGFTAAELSGGGTVDGDVELESGGVLKAGIAEDGSIAPLTVDGTLTLADFSLEFGGNTANLQPGRWTLVSAGRIEKLAGDIALPVLSRRDLSLVVTENEVQLRVAKKGMHIIVR